MIDFFIRMLLMSYMFNSLITAIQKAEIGTLVWAIVFWSVYMWCYPVFRKKVQIKE